MLVSERERMTYGASYGSDPAPRGDRYARYDYERSYEDDRNRTSPAYRDSLMNDLERPAIRSRLERSDEMRYGFYMSNISSGESNYDKFWDKKQQKAEEKPAQKSRLGFLIAFIAVAVVAIIAVTISVVGLSNEQTVVQKTLGNETISASAETVENDSALSGEVAAIGTEEVAQKQGGENYIKLKNGELVAVEVPAAAIETKEEEKGFDKFCSWLNGVFGG